MFNLLHLQFGIFQYTGLNLFLFLVLNTEPVVSSPACAYQIFAQDHTMCKYNAPACSIIRGGLNTEEQQEVIRDHNKARQKVATGHQQGQPSASNMREVAWCNELASIAQRWAEQCTFASDRNRRTKKYEHVGQNIFMSHSNSKTPDADVAQAVQTWFNEVKIPGFNASYISPFHIDQSATHYTQLVWADVDAIGCGFVHFQKGDHMYHKLTICNYATGGNVKDGVMYKVGPQCSDCPTNCSTNYPGLCSKPVIESSNSPENASIKPSATIVTDEEIVSKSAAITNKDKGLKYGLVDNDVGKVEFAKTKTNQTKVH